MVQYLLSAGYAEICRAKTNQDKSPRIILLEGIYILLSGLIGLYAISIICASTTAYAVQRGARMVIVAVAPFLMAATWADTQHYRGQDHAPATPGQKNTASSGRSLPAALQADMAGQMRTTFSMEGTGR